MDGPRWGTVCPTFLFACLHTVARSSSVMRLSPLAPFFYDAAAGRDAVPGKLLAVEIWGLGNGSQRGSLASAMDS